MTTSTQGGRANVTIAMPLYARVAPIAMIQFSSLFAHSLRSGCVAGAVFSEGCVVDEARNLLVRQAFENNPGMTHLMWLDSDVIAPPDTVERLLAHGKQVVGGLYHQKEPPFRPVAYELEPFKFVDSIKGPGLQRVGGLGFGCVLVRADVYQLMSQHFNDVHWYELSLGTGEDLHFFDRCREIGVDAWLDPTVRCGHVRDQVVTTDDWQRARS